MISVLRVLVLAGGCTGLAMFTAPPQPAQAQGGACKGEPVTVSGKAKFRPFSKTTELEGRGAAMADAVANWEREVGSRYGQAWKAWSRARDTTFDCAPAG